MDNVNSFLKLFPQNIADDLSQIPEQLLREGEELRMRKGYPATLISSGREYTLSGQAMGSIHQELLNNTINRFLNYSDYAHLEELRNGYISLQGGHRAGFSGQAVLNDGAIELIHNITSINLRLAKDVDHCDKKVWPHLFGSDHSFHNTLIVSPPGCGKTTMLRCLIRHLSNHGYQVSVCDERAEISGAGPDGFSFDLGARTDVMTGCCKEECMIRMLRSMGPQILAADEISSPFEVAVLHRAAVSGVKIITTIHGETLSDVLEGPIGRLVRNGTIARIVFLTDHPTRGTVKGIWKKERI